MDFTEIVFVIILMILSGWFLKTRGILSESSSVHFNRLVINVTMPALIFVSMTRNIHAEQLPAYLQLTFLMIIGTILCMALSWAAGKYILHLAPASLYAFMLVCSIGNTGFMGYPVCSAYFGAEGLTRAVFCDSSTTVTMITASVLLGTKLSGEKRSILREFLKFPIFLTWLGSMILIIFGFRADMLPEVVLTCLDMTAAITTPLIMISVGLSLSGKYIKDTVIPAVSTCFFRFLAAPVIVFALTVLFGITDLSRTVTVLEAGMPCAMAIMIFAEIYGMDRKLVSGATFLTTCLSLAAIPVAVYILQNVIV